MEKFVTWYFLFLKAQWKRLGTWLVLLGMIGLTMLLSAVKFPDQTNIRILVYCADEELASEVMHALLERESVFDFEEAQSLEEAKQQVLSGRAECAFEVQPDFRERLREGDRWNLVTYYAASFTTKGEVAKETFYAALLPIESEIFLENAIPELYEDADENLLSALKARQQEYLGGTKIFTVQEIVLPEGTSEEKTGKEAGTGEQAAGKTEDGEQAASIGTQTGFIRGTLAILIFFWIFFTIGEIRNENGGGMALVLDRQGKLLYSAAKSLAAVTMPGVLAFFLLWSRNDTSGFFPEFLGLLLLIGYSILWCLLLQSILKTGDRYLSCAVALLLLNIVICPAYMDLSAYFPVIKYLRPFLPVGAYLINFLP